MKFQDNPVGGRPDLFGFVVMLVTVAFLLTFAAQVSARDGQERQRQYQRLASCSSLMQISDTRINGRTARKARLGKPCRAAAPSLILGLWAVSSR